MARKTKNSVKTTENQSVAAAVSTRPVTLKDIAARCAFSMQTVSRALLRDPRISDATTQTILAVAAEMGYDPSHNIAARRMVLSQHGRKVLNRTIAYYTHLSSTEYHTDLVLGIWEGLALNNYILVLVHSQHPHTYERMPLPQIFKSGDVDGVIMFEQERLVDPIIEEMRREPNFGRRPVVSIIRPMSGSSSVLPDYRTGAFASANHLLDLGHRRIMHFFPPIDLGGYSGAQRLLGYQEACIQRGLDPNRHLLPHYNLRLLEWQHEEGIDEFISTLREHPDVTAVLARHDLEALKIIRALKKAGLRVPDDTSVIGFDDTNALYGEDGVNLLTSVRLPLKEIGRQAVELIIREVQDKATEETHIILPVELMPRATTAPPRSVH